MPIWTPYFLPSTTKTSTVTMPFNAGTVTVPVTFPTPMKDTNYVPTFSIGAGVAIPAITISGKTVNGYTATFTALVAGTIIANVVYL